MKTQNFIVDKTNQKTIIFLLPSSISIID